MAISQKKRVLSGMRPTGRLQIGNYFGALENWVKLQNDPQYECFFFVADWHALTSDYADTSQIAQNSIEVATDFLASGLDPAKCTIFLQSSVPEHAELHLLLSMVTPLSWLERVPTYKEALENVQNKDLHTHGFLGYPVLQTADIVMYGKAETPLLVPVGEDQKSHVELSREIVRRFNTFYGTRFAPDLFEPQNFSMWPMLERPLLAPNAPEAPAPRTREEVDAIEAKLRQKILEDGPANFFDRHPACTPFIQCYDVLIEPDVMLTQTPRVPGTDGRKMSKSYGNFITLSESDESIRAKTKVMVTDPARKRRTDPGNPDVCPVYDWHKLFSPAETLKWSAEGCRSAGIGCIECKATMAGHLIRWIAPIRARREEYAAHPEKVLRILDEGSAKAREVAQKTMTRVREAVFNWQDKRAEVLGSASAAAKIKAGD